MSLPEREKKPFYGGQLWLIDSETGEKIRWLGDESSGRRDKDGFSQKKDLPELKAPESSSAWPLSRINDDS